MMKNTFSASAKFQKTKNEKNLLPPFDKPILVKNAKTGRF